MCALLSCPQAILDSPDPSGATSPRQNTTTERQRMRHGRRASLVVRRAFRACDAKRVKGPPPGAATSPSSALPDAKRLSVTRNRTAADRRSRCREAAKELRPNRGRAAQRSLFLARLPQRMWDYPDVGGFRRRTPAPPPFSGVNSMPACSSAAMMEARLPACGTRTPRSKSTIVGRDTCAAVASSA